MVRLKPLRGAYDRKHFGCPVMRTHTHTLTEKPMRLPSQAARKILLLLLCAIWPLSDAAWAQSFRGSIGGTVQDPSGSVVIQATAVAQETATNVEQRTLTNSTGSYLFANLLPGLYRITISATGFKEATSENIVLTAQAGQRFDVTLEVGA